MKPIFVRNIVLDNLLEIFLVSAVAAILGIRFYLHFTGYPQIGNEVLHVTHTFIGGIIMVLGIMMFIHFINKSSVILATIITGLGFGTFLDELGKFITRDHNYFFEPVIAYIYIILMVLYLSFKLLSTKKTISSKEYLANSVEIIKHGLISGLDKDQLERAQYYLSKVRAGHPMIKSLDSALKEFEVQSQAHPLVSLDNKIRTIYRRIIATELFKTGVILFFIAQTLFALSYSFITTQILPPKSQLAANGQLIFASISTLFVLAGILSLRSRAKAFNLFKASVLVNIFFTQVFMFYEIRFEAMLGLLFDLALLYILNHLIYQEEILQEGS